MDFTLPTITYEFYLAAMPILILSIFAMGSLLHSVFSTRSANTTIEIAHYVGSTLALGSLFLSNVDQQFLNGSYSRESLADFGQALILSIAILASLLFSGTHARRDFFRGEIVSLFQMALVGMLIMVSANELISLFIGLELASIGLYALIGYIRPNRMSKEGAVKYLVLGSFASGFFLFGAALLYAGTGSMNISIIITALAENSNHPWLNLGGLLFMVGLAFKLALAPFHLWAPDAYEAAPTGLTAFMATAVKVMVVVVMLRFLVDGMSELTRTWPTLFAFAAAMSAIFGNVLALVQSSMKRMLAYSSVSHAGYLAIALCALSPEVKILSSSAIVFYLISYTVISLGTFGVLMWLETSENQNLHLNDLAGLARKHPWASFAFATFMFSFAGIPPTVGFMAKFFVFSAALKDGLYGLVAIGIIGAVISVFYYLRVIVKMYMNPPLEQGATLNSKRSSIIVAISASAIIAILLLGTFLPGPMLRFAQGTMGQLLTH